MMESVMAPVTIDQLWREAARSFATAGFESPEVEARVLLAGILHCQTTALLLRSDEIPHPDAVELYHQAVLRRLTHEPAAYILGLKSFMGFDFSVDPRVLIPRPETELLMDDLLMDLRDANMEAPRILDVGTGSGCIAVSLALLLPGAVIEASDTSPEALAVARQNAVRKDVRIKFRHSNLFSEFKPEDRGAFDMIVSNPPYIASSDLPNLQPELSFEPRTALEGGPDGLMVLRRLIQECPVYLKPRGRLALEIGHDQGDSVQALMEVAGFDDIVILKDHNGFDRIAKGTKRGSI